MAEGLTSENQPQSQTKTKMKENDNENHQIPTAASVTPYPRRQILRTLFLSIIILLLLCGITALILWLVYRPLKPKFNVVGAAIYSMNISSSNAISTSMQFTVATRNPNRRVAIYYDRLSCLIIYKNQAITVPTILPPLYQDRKASIGMSPMLNADLLPVSPEVANGLPVDEAYGVMPLRFVLTGRLKWKAAIFKSGGHRLYVKCDVFVGIKKGFVGQLPLLATQDCDVDA